MLGVTGISISLPFLYKSY